MDDPTMNMSMMDRWREANRHIETLCQSDSTRAHLVEVRDKLAFSAVSVGRSNPLLCSHIGEANRLAGQAARYAALVRHQSHSHTDAPRPDALENVEQRLREVGRPQALAPRRSAPAHAASDANTDRRHLACLSAVVSGSFRQLPPPAREPVIQAALEAASRIERGELGATGSRVLDKELWVDARRIGVVVDMYREEQRVQPVAKAVAGFRM